MDIEYELYNIKMDMASAHAAILRCDRVINELKNQTVKILDLSDIDGLLTSQRAKISEVQEKRNAASQQYELAKLRKSEIMKLYGESGYIEAFNNCTHRLVWVHKDIVEYQRREFEALTSIVSNAASMKDSVSYQIMILCVQKY